MRTGQGKHVLVCVLLLLGLLAQRPTGAQYLSFSEITSVARSDKFCASDLNADGCDEVLMHKANHVYLYVWDEDHFTLKEQLPQHVSWDLIGVSLADATGDPDPEVNVHLLGPDSLRIGIYRVKKDLVPSLADTIVVSRATVGGEISSFGPYPWDVGVDVLGRSPYTPASSPLLVAFLTGWSKQPRGACGFDPRPPHRMLWRQRVGPRVKSPIPVSWHSSPESTCIVLPGAASDNETCGSGFCDSVSAVFVVNASGDILWSEQLGGRDTEPYVSLAHLDDDEIPEVVTACSMSGKEPGSPSKLREFSLLDGRVRREIEVGTRAVGLATADMDGDLVPEIILLGADGDIRLYDANLNELHTAQAASEPWILRAGDVDYNGRPEIYVSAEAGDALHVFDGSLNWIGRVTAGCATINTVGIMSLSKSKRALAVGAHESMILYYASESKHPPWLEATAPTKGENLILWVTGGLLGGLVLAGLIWWTTRVVSIGRPVGAARALVAELSIVRHGTRVNGRSEESLVRLRRGLQTCCEPDGVELGRHIVRESGQAYESYVAPALRRILKLSAIVGPISLTLPLALAALRANRDVRQTLCQLGESGDRPCERSEGEPGSPPGSGDGFISACAQACGSVERLEALLRRLDKAALSRAQADPYSETAAAAESLAKRFDKEGVDLSGIEVSRRVGARVFIEPAALRQCLHDILLNAIEACSDATEPRVSVHIAGGERRVIFQIVDNGRGIRKESWEAIFHGRSTKDPRGGTGLSRARQVIESYSGRIFVRESTPWERTVFEIELCRAAS